MAKEPENIAASVRQRLLNLAREQQRVFDNVLVAFALERVIYRLSISDYRERFVLKGGMLVTLWTNDPGRSTRDVDFLSFGESNEDALIDAFSTILGIDADDGLVFEVSTIKAAPIREDQIYGGIRLKTTASLGQARIPITIDIGFGDALSDPTYETNYGSLLDFPTARVRTYTPATVSAEKFQAIVVLGAVNGRMKDLYDLWALPRAMETFVEDLVVAVRMTFERRGTAIPKDRPSGLSTEFSEDANKMAQWSAFSESTDLEGVSLADVTDEIWRWLEPVCRRARG